MLSYTGYSILGSRYSALGTRCWILDGHGTPCPYMYKIDELDAIYDSGYKMLDIGDQICDTTKKKQSIISS